MSDPMTLKKSRCEICGRCVYEAKIQVLDPIMVKKPGQATVVRVNQKPKYNCEIATMRQ